MDTEYILKTAVAVVGSVEMLKNFTKTLKVPGFVWALITIVFGVVYYLPFMPEWALNAVVVVSAATLFYDTIVQYFKKKLSGEIGGTNE